ncbi:MAG: SIMPL domain-containing protein, partial [Caulobacteraceae bacterium]
MKASLAAGALAALLMIGAAPAALAQAAPPAADTMFRATTLNLSAYGEVKTAPDMATISMGVQVEARTAAAAMRDNAVRMNQVVAALRQAGIADKDIQTSGLSLNPQYTYADNQPPVLRGYQASNMVTVQVNDLARLGPPIDAVVGAGANNLNGISFGLKDSLAAENQARLLAVQALQAKAALYANATGYRVSRLVSLSEGGGYSSPPPPMAMMAVRNQAKDESTSVSPGEMTVRVD